VLILELFGGQKVAHDERHLGPYRMLAHATFAGVLSRFSQVSGKITRPGPEVLHVGKYQVHHAQLGAEYTAHLIDKLLEDLVGFGSYRI
jgi:hypothetical protein